MAENLNYAIPNLNKIKEIAELHGFSVNMEIDPQNGFEVYNEVTQSGFYSLMTEDLSLFSINVYNPSDDEMVNVLSKILIIYNLPVEQLKQDFIEYNTNKNEIITNYNNYWVQYMPSENEDNVLLMRYRKFVEY